MSTHSRPKVIYDVRKLVSDMTHRGWMATDLAREAGVSDMTVSRFLTGVRRTAKTCKKLAEALGYTTKRYVLGVEDGAAEPEDLAVLSPVGNRRARAVPRRLGARRKVERAEGAPDRRRGQRR